MQAGTFITADGLKLHTVFAEAGECCRQKALVMLVHGYGEHCGRYTHVIKALTANGYNVYTLDHRGHGKSDGLRAYVDGFEAIICDLKGYHDQIAARQPDDKIFMIGHSMGALISLYYTLRHQQTLAGLITSGPPLTAEAKVSPLLLMAASAFNRLLPTAPIVDAIKASLASDPAVDEAFQRDPLTYKGKMRVRTGISISETSQYVRDHLADLRLPALFLHGEADGICPPSGSKLAYQKASSADKTLKLYPGMMHEIFNERDRDAVLADVVDWLNRRA
jgi:alpha-beta hydrolase superfamily lysophospholipase